MEKKKYINCKKCLKILKIPNTLGLWDKHRIEDFDKTHPQKTTLLKW